MKNVYFKILKISLSLMFFFTFWIGANYLTNIFLGEEKFVLHKILSALLMAIIFTYFTDCGAIFGKMSTKKNKKIGY
jgi:hypothetical protein